MAHSGRPEPRRRSRDLTRRPTAFVVDYWRRVLASPRGELWFGAHSRAAPAEMRSLAEELKAVVRRTVRPAPDLERLLAAPT